MACDVAQTSDSLAHGSKARSLAVRTRLAEARDARINHPRCKLRDDLRPEPPGLHRSRAKVLQQDVGRQQELAHDRSPFLAMQIERDAALVAREAAPPKAGAVFELTPAAQRIPAQRLDLDYVGAEVAEQAAGERASEQLTQLEDAQPLERARGGR